MRKRSYLVLLLSLFLFPAICLGSSIKEIAIKGNARIENDTILSYVLIKEGDTCTPTTLDETLKTLFETGYFKDIKIWQEGKILFINIEENPIINRVAFEGNSKLKDDDITKEIKLKPREVLIKSKIQEAQQRILEIYRRMGRYGAKVDPKIINLPENRVDLVFEIEEGPVTNIRRIQFVGNNKFSSKTLKECLLSKEYKWYRFFASDDVYDPDKIEGDQSNLVAYYQNRGYLDFRIISASAELSHDHSHFNITFTVDEGDFYKFGKVSFENLIQGVDIKSIEKAVSIKEGDAFCKAELNHNVQKIIEELGKSGYAFVSVDPIIKKRGQVADICFQIKQGIRVYIDKIEITGNDRTYDDVLLREIPLHPGDPYNSSKIKEAEYRIKNLDYFKKVTVEATAADQEDRANIAVNVEEQSTGEFSIAGGYSNIDGVLGNVKFVERNFRGRGQVVHSDLTVAKKRQEISLGIVEPYFLDRRLSGSADVFHTRSHRLSHYSHIMTGTNLGIGYKLTPSWGQGFGYSLKKESVTRLAALVSPYIASQSGNYFTSALTHTISYDHRNNPVRPTAGFMSSLSTMYSGIGGNVYFLKNDLRTTFYYAPFEDIVVTLTGNFGVMNKISNKTIRVVDSYMLGADSFRGFSYGGLGPRDIRTTDALGGTRTATGTLEATFPVGLPAEFGIRGAMFSDFGTLWKAGVSGKGIVDNKKMRSSAGVGILWDSPFGSLRIDYAVPMKKELYDETQRLLFGYSSRV